MPSSSSTSSYSSSSSSLGCCTNPYCEGPGCAHFITWTFAGMNYDNTAECGLYVIFDGFGTYQQVEIYRDLSYSELVAIGQSNAAGTIILEERNDSGLTGSVVWDGVLMAYPNETWLNCFEFSSSSTSLGDSSSESFDSSSTSSQSRSSYSSSSSGCCINPVCEGDDCFHFSVWTIYGSNDHNSNNCTLYVVFEYIIPNRQEIRLYKSLTYDVSDLVAVGQGVTGLITLSERNSSGITGSVVWDGTQVDYPSFAILDCEVSSSSSSSSSSFSSLSSSSTSFSSSSSPSTQSSSSISSQSSSSSTSQSSLSESTSSTSWSSSSSSSSIDSSSSSSIDSSSSSSFEGWNRTKPFTLGMSSVNSSTIKNRLAQTIFITEDVYSIGTVFCYFYGPYGEYHEYTLHMDIYTCSDDGKPLTIIATKSLAGSNITQDGWYSFDFNTQGITPNNGYISFVIWQENGNEDDYVLWGYAFNDTLMGALSWFSNDAVNWIAQNGILRALKVVGNFNAYDLTNFRIVTPTADRECLIHELDVGSPSYSNTELVGGTQYDPERVVISYPPLLTSIIVDSSGSMGWNDRFSSRQEFIGEYISRLQTSYPSEILFDMVKFGAQIADTDSVFADIGKPVTIDLDLTSPTRNTFTFTTTGCNASDGAVYEANNYSFTVSQNISGQFILVAIANGDSDPWTAGTLVKISGAGDASISYASFNKAKITDTFVAYGFKNMQEDHHYNIASISIGNSFAREAALKNWQALVPGGGVVLTIGTNGPNGEDSLDLVASSQLVLRQLFIEQEMLTSLITHTALRGSETIVVSDTSIAGIDEKLDFVDRDHAALGCTVTNVSSISYDFTPGLESDIGSWNTNAGITQQSSFDNAISINDITARLLVKDPIANQSMTFFLQNSNGFMMEWDFAAFQDWYIYNLYYIDETALLPVSVFDIDGNPFPDGTKIIFYVNQLPSDSTQSDQRPSETVTEDAVAGSSQIYMQSTEGFVRNQEVDLLDNIGNVQTVTVTEVDTDLTGNFIKFDPVLQFNFKVSNGAKVVESINAQDLSNASSEISSATLLSASIGLVDATPIYTGKNLDPSLLAPYDPTPVTPSMTFDELNLDRDRMRNNIVDVPTIDGTVLLRILPITEDNLKTINEKNEETARLIRPESPQVFVDQSEQTEGDFGEVQIEEEDAVANLTTTTTTLLSKGEDYEIDNPIYLLNGLAESALTTFATEFEEMSFPGINVPGVTSSEASTLLVKPYTIYPAIVMESSNGTEVAKQYLPEFEVFFTPPISIYSEYDGGTVSLTVAKSPDEECPSVFQGYEIKSINGVYASGSGFTIEYIASNMGSLIVDGELTIKIYSNTVIDIADIVNTEKTRQDLDVVLPQVTTINSDGTTEVTQPLTAIGAWIEAVENNPSSQIIEDSDGATTSEAKEYQNIAISRAKASLESAGYVNSASSGGSTFEYYTNPWEWTKATQYEGYQEFTVTIVNGKASIIIPDSDISALLLIQASISFGDNNKFQFIRSDLIPVANPIDIQAISPDTIFAKGGTETYEIGTSVTWKGSSIADNVVVSFNPPSTQGIPSVSKTDSGNAAGVYLGPHAEVEMTCPDPNSESALCPCTGIQESIGISVNYLGYTRTVSRIIEWTGSIPDLEDENELYFKVNVSTDTAWANGNNSSGTTLSSDLDNDLEDLLWIGEDGILRLKGYDQPPLPPEFPDGAPRAITYSAGGLTVKPNQERWTNGIASAEISGLNQNIGHQQPQPDTSLFVENSPWTNIVTNLTSYKSFNEDNGQYKTRMLTGVVEYPYYSPGTSGEPILVVPYPMVSFKEPLDISVEIESYDREFIRNGYDTPLIVATVTWEGNPINGKFIQNRGMLNETEVDYPFPTVTFEAGICKTVNGTPGTGITYMIDARNTADGCLEIEHHPDVSLNSYATKASLSRTDINVYVDGDISNTHTHSCSVNSDGNGTTTGTIVLTGLVGDHTHIITNYQALSSGSPSHTHNLRCVAIVNLNPLTNPNVNIAINGMVVYDPTKALPYVGDGSSPYPSTFTDGNRMMFSTLYIDSVVQNRELILSVATSNNYTTLDVTDTDRGINILVTAMFSEYTVETEPGKFVVIPSQPVPDGTRVVFNIDTFKALSAEDANSIVVIRPDAVRKYMYIRINAKVYSAGLQASETATSIISSNLQWLPSVQGLLIEPTNDDIYLADAISKINNVGSSQINDAIYRAADQIITYQTDNPLWKDAQKVILLLTDGDENTSEYSLDQAMDRANFIDGKCEVPVIPIRLGFSYSSDDVLLGKYASDTCGNNHYLINATTSDIKDVLDNIITDGTIRVNDGTYTNTIDLGLDNVSSTISLSNIIVPTGSRITFRTRFSSDNITWSTWSEWFDSSSQQDFELSLQSKGRYFQYQIHLYGNENFESPSLFAGAEICYYKVQTFTVFFQPVDIDINSDEYLASIHITHQATIPDTSSITYGYAQFDTTNIEDYYGVTQPLITPDRHTIILTRYNEMFLTEDHKTYTAINGRWPEQATIEVYRVNTSTPKGELINPSTYGVNSDNGIITFYNTQRTEDNFVLCVYFDPAFRIICNVTNYGPEAVIIDHIGVLYNITKRIPRDLIGNIIHTPINERL